MHRTDTGVEGEERKVVERRERRDRIAGEVGEMPASVTPTPIIVTGQEASARDRRRPYPSSVPRVETRSTAPTVEVTTAPVEPTVSTS